MRRLEKVGEGWRKYEKALLVPMRKCFFSAVPALAWQASLGGQGHLGGAVRGRRGSPGLPTTSPFQGPSIDPFSDFFFLIEIVRLSCETSTKEDLALEAWGRPETRLELLTIISSIRFFFRFLLAEVSQ